jgi:hypothetical protein
VEVRHLSFKDLVRREGVVRSERGGEARDQRDQRDLIFLVGFVQWTKDTQ